MRDCIHSTRYEKLPDSDLYALYRETVFSRLTSDEKLDLMQETVNRDALERGMASVPKVSYADLPSNMGGYYKDGVIRMNHEMVVSSENCHTLCSLLHENIHGWQEQVEDGIIQTSEPKLLREYQANRFSSSVVLQNGSYKMGSQYLLGKTSSYLYYFQASERDAKLGAEMKTNSILQALAEKFGMEKSFQEYAKEVSEYGYHAMETKAIELYQNPDFVRDVNRVLVNHKFGINLQVDKETEEAVKTEMIASYRELYLDIKTEIEKEETNMRLDEPVTMEDYNHSLEESAVQEAEAADVIDSETEGDLSSADNEADNSLGGDDDLDM